MRKVIRQLTGGIARGVTPGDGAARFAVILSFLRPELTERACVAKLQRADGPAVAVPALDHVPLTGAVREWSDQLLADLTEV